jgi:uncharacterized protein involved in response to NO
MVPIDVGVNFYHILGVCLRKPSCERQMTESVSGRESTIGAAVMSHGFRPFFLLAGIWSLLAMGIWLGMLADVFTPPTALAPVDWHLHELLYGYLSAVVAGFLLTAVPNWTGRLPLRGQPLFALATIWLAGRVAILLSAQIGHGAAMVIDLAFLAVLDVALIREIVVGRNWKNLSVIALVTLLLAGNTAFHIDVASLGYSAVGDGMRMGLAGAVFLIMLIGGRIVPSFTRNWLVKRGPGRLPAPFGKFDFFSLAGGGFALAAWIVFPDHRQVGWLCLFAGLLQAARLARWAGERCLGEGLVLILHVGYGFVPVGFGLLGYSILEPSFIATSVALHAWTAGAIGVMTLAVMTRASLGHTGRPLHATLFIVMIYICVALATVMRIAAGFNDNPNPVLYASAVLWMAGFGLFTVLFAPMLLKPRLQS